MDGPPEQQQYPGRHRFDLLVIGGGAVCVVRLSVDNIEYPPTLAFAQEQLMLLTRHFLAGSSRVSPFNKAGQSGKNATAGQLCPSFSLRQYLPGEADARPAA